MATRRKAQTEVEDQFKDKIVFRQAVTAKVKIGDSYYDLIDVWLDVYGNLNLKKDGITVEKDYIPAFIHAVKLVTGVK